MGRHGAGFVSLQRSRLQRVCYPVTLSYTEARFAKFSRLFFSLLAGIVFCVGSAIALILSATVGFLGLHDGLGVPWAGWALVTELAGFVVLTACAGVTMWRR